MCKNCWQDCLRVRLKNPHKRLAILGIGHELRGDDAAGIAVIRQLQSLPIAQENVLLVEAGSAPENVTGQVRRFMPDTILLIDAVQFNRAAGTIQVIDLHELATYQSDTHRLSIKLVADFLAQSLLCEVFLLAIQPAQLEFDQGLSPEICAARDEIVQFLYNWLQRDNTLIE